MINIFTMCPSEYFGSNTYIIGCNGEYAVIDPSVEYSVALSRHPEIEGKIKYILLTHAHFDHILKINSWVSDTITVIVGAKDAPSLSDSYRNCYLGFFGIDDGFYGKYSGVNDGFTFKLGNEPVTVIDCPGHTPGGVAYLIGNDLFVGDTVFADGGYGRCDLPGGNISDLEKSIFNILTLGRNFTLYPGHGPKTTVNEAKKYFI